MFGERKASEEQPGEPIQPGARLEKLDARRRHGRRPIRSSLSGPIMHDPNSRIEVFRQWAAIVIQYLRQQLPGELDAVNIGFLSVPPYENPEGTESNEPMFWLVNKEEHTIYLFRTPIQRFRGLHQNDEIHRRLFVESCAYQAVCEYLGQDPWTLLPGRFDHY